MKNHSIRTHALAEMRARTDKFPAEIAAAYVAFFAMVERVMAVLDEKNLWDKASFDGVLPGFACAALSIFQFEAIQHVERETGRSISPRGFANFLQEITSGTTALWDDLQEFLSSAPPTRIRTRRRSSW